MTKLFILVSLTTLLHNSAWGGVEQCLQLSDDRMIAQCTERYRADGGRAAGTRRQAAAESKTSGYDGQLTAVTPNAATGRSVASTTSSTLPPKTGSSGDNSALIPIVFFIGMGIWIFCAVIAALGRGAAKAAEATVIVGAAATGLTVGVLEGAVRRVAARYASCPYCLSVIRSRASVCKHCLRTLS